MLQFVFKSYCNVTWDRISLCGQDNSKANIISHVILYAFL